MQSFTDTCTIAIDGRSHTVTAGSRLLDVLRQLDKHISAPCGGQGTCKKCLMLVDGVDCLACQTIVQDGMDVRIPVASHDEILTTGLLARVNPDGADCLVLAFDIGTTTIVAYLLDGQTGEQLAVSSALNPQGAFGADVMSRIQYARENGARHLQRITLNALDALAIQAAQEAGVDRRSITLACFVGNTCMHHLALGIDIDSLATPPYMPAECAALEVDAAPFLPSIASTARLRVLPNIAGFVGADTVGCLVAADFDRIEELTLLIDIGTNGEMILGNRERRIACSAAAGPAFEGALIECGMRGADGAIDHVRLEREGANLALTCSVIGDGKPVGLCGSGLLDAVAALLDAGVISTSGQLKPHAGSPLENRACEDEEGGAAIELADGVYLSQKDIRQVQMAKGAIRAGIELLTERAGVRITDIDRVLLAGAFGSRLDPRSACRIGMLPPELLDRIQPIGNAAGEGAKACALSAEAFERSKALAAQTEFLELASIDSFQDEYIASMGF